MSMNLPLTSRTLQRLRGVRSLRAGDAAATVGALVGVFVLGYGLSLGVPSPAGVAACTVGLALVCSGLLGTGYVGNRLGLPDETRTTLSVLFAAVAALSLVALATLDPATFEPLATAAVRLA